MADKNDRWRKYAKIKFDGKKISDHARRAEAATVGHAREFVVHRWSNIREARRLIIGWLVLVLLLIAAVGLQMLLFKGQYRTQAAAAGGTYAEATLGTIETLNPLYASSSAELSAARLMFSSLYQYDTQGGLKSDLAESMSIENKGRTYFIKLRDGLKWHDGQPITASDVVFTINTIKDPASRSYLSPSWQGIEVEATNDQTVKFTLPATIAAFQHALVFPVLPKHILADVPPGTLRENSFSSSPVGSGPFKFRRLQTANVSNNTKIVHMTRFDEYHMGVAKLDRFQLHAYSDREMISTALKTGEVNGAAHLHSNDAAVIDTNRYEVSNVPVYGGVYSIFNTERPIISDSTVRKALRLALDTGEVRSNVSVPDRPLDLPFLPEQVQADLPKPPSHDAKKAASMLDSAGWKLDGEVRKKDGKPLSIEVVTIKDSEYEKVVESLAGQWRSLGVEVKTTIVDASAAGQDVAQTVLRPRAYDVLVYELSIGADPDVYAYWHSSQATQSGRNLANYTSGVSDDALVSARSRLETDLRGAKYASFAEEWLDDVPAIGIYQSNFVYVNSKKAETLRGGSMITSPSSRYADVVNWTVERETVYKTP